MVRISQYSAFDEYVSKGLAFIDALPVVEQRAFLGLFAGARSPWSAYSDGRCPMIGKAECEWVDDWRDFYQRKLPGAGLLTFEESEPKPALGATPGTTYTTIHVHATDLGRAVREAWWNRLEKKTARP